MAAITQYDMTPTIVGIADSTHYLVGLTDSSDNLVGLNGDVAVLGSLVEAKQYLRDHNVSSAMLEFQTAYDEMCGSSTHQNVKQSILL